VLHREKLSIVKHFGDFSIRIEVASDCRTLIHCRSLPGSQSAQHDSHLAGQPLCSLHAVEYSWGSQTALASQERHILLLARFVFGPRCHDLCRNLRPDDLRRPPEKP
jgi:hypothetical protein